MRQRTAVDLFCGSGGVTAGLKAADWNVLAALDKDPIAATTYKRNHPEVKLVREDISDPAVVSSLRKAVGRRKVDLLVVCAPCQPFSSQNRKRGSDPREQLILHSLVAVSDLRPKVIFFENVPGLATAGYREIVRELRERLAALGYLVTNPLVKDAASFGVPQRRKRCIMLAGKTDKSLSDFKAALVDEPARSVYDAISRLLPLESGQSHPTDPLHRARTHNGIALERLHAIPRDGGSRSSLPEALTLACHRSRKANAFPDVYGRMAWDTVAPTLTTGCTDVTRGRFAHPVQHRAITLREAARLQTFDDDYSFAGTWSQIAAQIGNAVPPAMVAAMSGAFSAAVKASVPRKNARRQNESALHSNI